MLDLQIGRWHTIDPMGEKFESYNVYNFCLNNPLRFIDPNGMESMDTIRRNIYMYIMGQNQNNLKKYDGKDMGQWHIKVNYYGNPIEKIK